MADADFRSFQQLPKGRTGVDLALVTAKRMDIRMERCRRSHRRIGGKRAGDQSCLCRAMGAEKTSKGQSGRCLRAVDQRQTFLGR